MKNLLTALLMCVLLASCEQDAPAPTKHELVLDLYSITANTVLMYDRQLQKDVAIPYSLSLFKMSMVELYECQSAHPVFTFYYSNSKYYSL